MDRELRPEQSELEAILSPTLELEALPERIVRGRVLMDGMPLSFVRNVTVFPALPNGHFGLPVSVGLDENGAF